MSPLPTAHLPIPALLLEGEGRVSSADFGDVYFSRADGVAETRHVFLAGNGLPERWQGRDRFTIGELGFGTGQNFHVAYAKFLATSMPGQHLHFISVEQFPLTQEQFVALRPESPLATCYPLRLPGWHRIQLPGCTLTLGFGDAQRLLEGIDAAQVDAWFLDGFAPAKNAAMWTDEIFAAMARLSAPDATLATFTAAGFVKRGLAAQGFAMRKVTGFAHKRDMLVGAREGVPAAAQAPRTALVIGAGIAGSSAARALAERGIAVTVAEAAQVAAGASGNPVGALYPQLTKYYTPATAWHLIAYAYMLRQLPRWEGVRWGQTGMVRLPREGDGLAASLQLDPAIARMVSAAEAEAIAGCRVARDGAFLPHGAWVEPASLCRALLTHERITLREATPVRALVQGAQGWQAEGVEGHFGMVVVATAGTELLKEYPLPLGHSAGQVSVVPSGAPLRCIVSHRGYVIPQGEVTLVGATYDHDDFSRRVTEENHDENRRHAKEALPDWQDAAPLGGRTALRASTPDRLPYVGHVADGLYVSIGHGSRGLISAPWAAEIIAAQATGDMVPLTPELRAAIHPLRRAKP